MDKALIASDALEKSLKKRIADVYGEALKRAVRNNRAFLTNVKNLDEHAKKLEAGGWTSEKIEKWRKEEVLRLLRQQRLVQSIADEMDRAGMEIAPEIKARMAEVYKVNSDATFRHINSRVNANFALIPKAQVKIILDDAQPVFSKIAYQHLGKNKVIRDALQSQMAQAAILGESQEKIIKRIQKVTGQAEYQARRVAQTERNRVQSQARADALHEAAQAGVIVTKKWSARMRNTRDSHAALNGVEIPENEKFRTIWGNELRYPGDPEAPASEVCNCHCVLIPGVLLPGENTDARLKNAPKSDIIKGEERVETAPEKAAAIEKEFRYTDAWGDAFSPIDSASFAAMPTDAQEQAAAGIRKAKELFRLDTLPERISFGDTRGAFGMYSEKNRTLTLSRARCKAPAEAYSTMVHELTHYYDQKSGHIAEGVYKQALKELGLRANSKEAANETLKAIGLGNRKEAKDLHEVLAYSVENAVKGSSSILAKKILEIIGRK